MKKSLLITGSTDGIGLETAKILAQQGHHLIIHGRSEKKINDARQQLLAMANGAQIDSYCADLSDMHTVKTLAQTINTEHKIDVIINNAGVYKTPNSRTADGLDVRFAVNTIAPYLLTKELLPQMDASARVINLASAAQAPVDLKALTGDKAINDDMSAYAQSKLALIMWSFALVQTLGQQAPAIIAINPGSLLASKMVKEGFGVAGHDLSIGANILVKAALSPEFKHATGQYFDNDRRDFSAPHIDAMKTENNKAVLECIEQLLQQY